MITGTQYGDNLVGTPAGEEIFGLGGSDTIAGLGGGDTLDGGTGNDTLDGGSGNDTFVLRGAEAGRDVITGGDGVDTLQLVGTAVVILPQYMTLVDVEIFVGNGLDVMGSGGADIWDFSSFTSITGLGKILGLRGFDQIRGSGLDDYIDLGGGDDQGWCGDGNDVMLGGTGFDRMFGEGGNDYFELGTFADRVDGGAGNDTVMIRTVDDYTDTIDGGADFDTVRVDTRLVASGGTTATTATVTLNGLTRITNVEEFDGSGQIVKGTSASNLFDFGTRFASTINVAAIEGLAGNDTIISGSAGDTIDGGAGNDAMTGGAGNDTFRFIWTGASLGRDTITDFDASDNDVIAFSGFGAPDPLAALEASTTFGAAGATIALASLGGSGTILLAGVTGLDFTGGEDFAFL